MFKMFNKDLSQELKNTESTLNARISANNRKYNSAIVLLQEAATEAKELAKEYQTENDNIKNHISVLENTVEENTNQVQRLNNFSENVEGLFEKISK